MFTCVHWLFSNCLLAVCTDDSKSREENLEAKKSEIVKIDGLIKAYSSIFLRSC